MVRVKLCGMRTLADAREAARAGADYIGFVLASSKREVSAALVRQIVDDLRQERAAELRQVLLPQSVLVLVNRSAKDTLRLADETGVRHVQLSGDETPALCAELRGRGLTVWKTWRVRGTEDDEAVGEFAGHIDGLLLDSWHGGAYGGTGRPFAWPDIDRLKPFAAQAPLIVAGGLSAATAGELAARYQPFAVDVSSGIETDGRKDPAKMRAFVSAAKN
ncbi:MAG: phosphoribosylanthranilate isomerase [Bacilli bacterium]